MFLAFSALSPVVSFYIGGDAVLKLAGTGAALAFIAGGVASALLALLYAEVGAAFPGAGGLYPSLAALFGPALAFPYIVLVAPIAFAAVGFTALGLADYVRVLVPEAPSALVALLGLALASIVAVLNLRTSTKVTGAFLTIEMLALLILSAVALAHPGQGLLQALQHPVRLAHGRLEATPVPVLALAAVSGVWATSGANWALYFAEDMKEAERRIGRVIAWTGLLAAIAVALPMALLVAGVRDPTSLLAAETPIAAFLRAAGGPQVAAVVSLGVAAAIFNSLVANIMGFGRYFYATGRDRVWPSAISAFLGRLSRRWRSPVAATVLIAIVAGAMALAVGEKNLLILLAGNVSDYLLISIAVLVGRKTARTGARFRIPGHPVLPIFGLLVTALSMAADAFDPDAGRPSIVLLTGLFLGALLYFQLRLRDVSRRWFTSTSA
jgi:amino acid transporter